MEPILVILYSTLYINACYNLPYYNKHTALQFLKDKTKSYSDKIENICDQPRENMPQLLQNDFLENINFTKMQVSSDFNFIAHFNRITP